MFCTDEATAQYIMSHLDEDLESLAHSTPPSLPITPSLPQSRISHGRILQVGNACSTTTTTFSNDNETGSPKENEAIVLPEASILILQVVRVQDASQSLEQHLRSLTSTDGNTINNNNNGNKIKSLTEIDDVTSTRYGEMALQMSEEAEQEAWAKEREKFHNKGSFISNNNNSNSNKEERGMNDNNSTTSGNGSTMFTKGTSRYRHLKLELTDGFTRIIAVEDRHVLCNCEWHMMNKNNNREGEYNLSLPLFPHGVAFGAKIKVEWSSDQHNKPRVTCGILRLNGKNTSLMGHSGVAFIQSYCETAARYLLQSMTGKPAKLSFNNHSANNVNAAEDTLPNPENTENHIVSITNNNDRTQDNNEPVQEHPSTFPFHSNQSNTSSSPITSSTSNKRVLQPLEEWHSFCEVNRHVAYATFHTRAIISGVLNDLEMREFYCHNGDNNNDKNNNEMTSSIMQVHYSLLVSLSPPPPPPQSLSSSETANTSISVTCDLGNTFLTTLIGMNASEFRQLHLSHNEDDRQRVQKMIEQVSMTLEHFDVADFTLKPYHSRQIMNTNTNAHNNAHDSAEMFYRAELIAVQPLSLHSSINIH